MDIIKLVGIIAIGSSWLMIVLGLPSQIYKIHRHKSAQGVSREFMVLFAFAYAIWSVYAFLVKDYFLLSAQLPGLFLSLILSGQIFYYSKKNYSKERRS